MGGRFQGAGIPGNGQRDCPRNRSECSSRPTSAVLFFDCGKNRLVFAADSQASQWKQIPERSGRAIRCNVLAVSAVQVALRPSALTPRTFRQHTREVET